MPSSLVETKILKGKPIAQQIDAESIALLQGLSFVATIVDITVGPSLVTSSYVALKKKAAERITAELKQQGKSGGIDFVEETFPYGISLEHLKQQIMELQESTPNLCGMIIQLPLPEHLASHQQEILDCIHPRIDVDVLSTQGISDFYDGKNIFAPTTAMAVVRVMESAGIQYQGENIKDQNVVVIGQGLLVGKPVTHMLRDRGATVRVADKETSPEDLRAMCLAADVIITAAGSPNLLTGDMVNSSVVIVDAGTSESGDQVVGDVDYDSLFGKVRAITPQNFGGVGPVTVATLLHNVAILAERSQTN